MDIMDYDETAPESESPAPEPNPENKDQPWTKEGLIKAMIEKAAKRKDSMSEDLKSQPADHESAESNPENKEQLWKTPKITQYDGRPPGRPLNFAVNDELWFDKQENAVRRRVPKRIKVVTTPDGISLRLSVIDGIGPVIDNGSTLPGVLRHQFSIFVGNKTYFVRSGDAKGLNDFHDVILNLMKEE